MKFHLIIISVTVFLMTFQMELFSQGFQDLYQIEEPTSSGVSQFSRFSIIAETRNVKGIKAITRFFVSERNNDTTDVHIVEYDSNGRLILTDNKNFGGWRFKYSQEFATICTEQDHFYSVDRPVTAEPLCETEILKWKKIDGIDCLIERKKIFDNYIETISNEYNHLGLIIKKTSQIEFTSAADRKLSESYFITEYFYEFYKN